MAIRTEPAIVAILCDYAEEAWPSMDLVAEMVLQGLQHHQFATLRPVRIRPRFIRRLSRFGNPSRLAINADRLLNRMFDYPRYLRRIRHAFDVFHVVDHSYGHLLLELPSHRSAITCHDLMTFRCVLEPELEPRSRAFRLMTRRILNGFARAGRVACDSGATRTELLRYGLAQPDHTVVIPNGVAPIFTSASDPPADHEASRLLGPVGERIELLNVGSTVGRKCIDILLRVFAVVRKQSPRLRLIRVGGRLTTQQTELACALGVGDAIVELPFLSVSVLAAVYRRAALLLCPSEAEGFGLPLLEAMACGTPAVVSDLAALREIGGDGVAYVCRRDVRHWTATVTELLVERSTRPGQWKNRRQLGIDRAQSYSWQTYAERTAEMYRDLLD